MTNDTKQGLRKLAKILLILFLIFIGIAVFGTFMQFSKLEKELSDPGFDYENLVLDKINDSNSNLTNNNLSKEDLISGDGSNYSLGTKNPKITIVEFADFSCHYCKQSFSKIREISIKYNKDIKYIFRDLPMASEESATLALAARCAGEQGLFWPMHDRLYLNQGNTADLSSLARKSGVKIDKFEQCMKDERYLAQINKDLGDALELGLDKIGTPVWYINGEQIAGDIPEEIFIKIIESTLNK